MALQKYSHPHFDTEQQIIVQFVRIFHVINEVMWKKDMFAVRGNSKRHTFKIAT